jgi:hypothetical protein
MRKLSEDTVATIKRVKELAIYREEYISKQGKPPLFQPASDKIGISFGTVKRLSPELFLI